MRNEVQTLKKHNDALSIIFAMLSILVLLSFYILYLLFVNHFALKSMILVIIVGIIIPISLNKGIIETIMYNLKILKMHLE